MTTISSSELADLLEVASAAFRYPEHISAHHPELITTLSRLMIGPEAINLEELKAEHTRLFTNAPGGVPAPPYASVYLDSNAMLLQEGASSARDFYLRAGLEPGEEAEMPDHVSVELAFAAHLLRGGDPGILKDFVKSHLDRWLPLFLAKIEEAEPHPFYMGLARLTSDLLTTLKEEVPDEETAVS